jgi:hypothetical protein
MKIQRKNALTQNKGSIINIKESESEREKLRNLRNPENSFLSIIIIKENFAKGGRRHGQKPVYGGEESGVKEVLAHRLHVEIHQGGRQAGGPVQNRNLMLGGPVRVEM